MPVNINWPAVMATAIPNFGSVTTGYFVKRNIHWFESLKKPSWMLPAWSIGPMWTGFYCTLGYSSYMVWRDGGGFEGACAPLTIYASNIILNWSWVPLFFGTRRIKWALYENAALCINTAALLLTFHDVNPTAAYLNIPYLCWSIYAVAVNYFIYRENKQIPADEKVADEKVKEVAFS
ncbi:translocator protein [Harpegnathos saltator]|uniref:Translocator protein n=1 Tax=Harpegnathos saltator TaxID=610380 RepID=E2B7G5_HARSA|nr:translocator protein [Harpegnathos saltator]XP_011153996.1 translocator protein [Harpegnathos saltator]EFN88340.1 Translocator protein [Harpegnathos saltator]